MRVKDERAVMAVSLLCIATATSHKRRRPEIWNTYCFLQTLLQPLLLMTLPPPFTHLSSLALAFLPPRLTNQKQYIPPAAPTVTALLPATHTNCSGLETAATRTHWHSTKKATKDILVPAKEARRSAGTQSWESSWMDMSKTQSPRRERHRKVNMGIVMRREECVDEEEEVGSMWTIARTTGT